MLRRHIVLLIAIRPSDGDVNPGGPLDAFREEQAMSRHRVSPSPFLSSSSSHTTQLHYTNSYTYSHPNLNFCPSGAWFVNRPHLTPSIRLARNPKYVIVQLVGIRTDRHSPIFYPPPSYSHPVILYDYSPHWRLWKIIGLEHYRYISYRMLDGSC